MNHISSVLDLRKCEVFLGSLRRARGPTRRLCHRSCNPAAAPDYILAPLVFFQAGSALLMTQSRSFASEKTRLSGVHHVWSLLISCSVSDGERTRTPSHGLIGAACGTSRDRVANNTFFGKGQKPRHCTHANAAKAPQVRKGARDRRKAETGPGWPQ